MRASFAVVILVWSIFSSPLIAMESLVPNSPNLSPDYFCTWNVQGYACSYFSSAAQRRAMVEQNLFGHEKNQGWADFYPSVRDGLFLVLDDSWDVPLNGDQRYFGSLILDNKRFPSFTGTPTERLQKLSNAVRDRGWRGLGGWVCAQQAPAYVMQDDDAYWTQRLNWMHDAGIRYWKVDWGEKGHDAAWRLNLTRLAANSAPDLIIEHALAEGSLKSAAVYRTYDVENVIAAPVTIARIADLLRKAPKGSPTLINCEDEPYIAAGTGAAMGVMRHPFAGAMPNGQQDFVFPPVGRDLKRRLDEVIRCVNWHRMANPLPLTGEGDTIDAQKLTDSWTLGKDETWTAHHVGDHRDGSAPARIARGDLAIPTVEVDAGELLPYVLVSRSPNGSVSIATIGRTRDRTYTTPKARVTQNVGNATTIGVFGVFAQLTLRFKDPIDHCQVLAQDLAGNDPTEITAQVAIGGTSLALPGELISKVGLSAAHADDLSEPGLVLVIRK
jgi:hypothetical protein